MVRFERHGLIIRFPRKCSVVVEEQTGLEMTRGAKSGGLAQQVSVRKRGSRLPPGTCVRGISRWRVALNRRSDPSRIWSIPPFTYHPLWL